MDFAGACSRWTVALAALLAAASAIAAPPDSIREMPVSTSVARAQGSATPAFERAQAHRVWSFPRDHGQHPRFRLEWWYYTGIVRTGEGRAFGYQVTFFRQGLTPAPSLRASAWRTQSLYLAHLAISDIGNHVFRYASRAGRDSLALSGAATDRHQVWLGDWKAEPLDRAGHTIRLSAQDPSIGVSLTLTAQGPPILHGAEGLDQKGAAPGEASWYYSIPNLQTSGEITVDGKRLKVAGVSWMDHEFGTSQLGKNEVGWDWFSVRLDSGIDLMLYRLRNRDGSFSLHSGGTLIAPSGQTTRLRLVDRPEEQGPEGSVAAMAIPDQFWISPATAAKYPLSWTIRIPKYDLILSLRPAFQEQELLPGAGLSFGYWEGVIWVQGTQAGRPVRGEGYLELTGYSGDLSGSFR